MTNPFLLSAIEEQQTPQAPANPFSRSAIEADQRQDLRVTLTGAVRENPDSAAEAARLAKRYPAPNDVLLRNLRDVQLQEAVDRADEKLGGSPKLADYMRNSPFVAKQAHDDLDTLSGLEQVFNVVRSVPAGAVKGAGAIASGTGEILNIGARATGLTTLSRLVRDTTGFDPNILFDVGGSLDLVGGGLKTAGAAIGVDDADKNFATDVGEGIGQLAQQIALQVATGGGASLLTLFAQGVDVMDEKTAKDESPEAIKDAAKILGGSITALTEKYGIDALLNRVPPAIRNTTLRWIADKLVAGGIEASQEIAEGVLQDLTRVLLTNPDAPIGDGALYEGSVAGTAAAIVRSALGVRGRVQQRQQDVDNATQSAEQLAQAMQLAAASKLRERNPETFRDLIQQMADGTEGAPTSVFIDGQVLQQAVQGMDPAALQQAFPSLADQLDAAVASNGVVELPISEVLAAAPGTPLEQVFLQNARADANALSLAEAEQQAEQAEQYLKTEAERVLQQAQDQTAWQTSADTVKATILEQLNTAGRFSPDVNEAYATMVRDFFSVTASRQGMTPEQLYARYPLRVAGVMPGQGGGQILDQRQPGTWYHGTTSDVQKFNRVGGGNMWGPGYYLTDNPDTASGYALGTAGNRLAPEGNAGPNVMPVRVADGDLFEMTAPVTSATLKKVEKALGQKLKDYTWAGMKNRDLRQVLTEQFTDQAGANALLQKAGFKGLVEASPIAGPGRTLMVFDAKDISSDITGGVLAQAAQNAQTDELTGLPLNPDGTVTLYHHTSAAKAAQITKTGKLKSAAEPDVYLTTRKETDTGYGDTAVAVRVNPELLQIDDEFPDGRTDYRIATGKPGGQIAVKVGEYEGVLNQATKQTDTPEFKAWFGDSKVVDASGQPLVVYNGSAADFDSFDRSALSPGWYSFGRSFYFAESPDAASEYAKKDGGNIKPVYLAVNAPYIIDNPANFMRDMMQKYGRDGAEQARNDFIAQGYDGLHYTASGTFVAFRPEQIKSAIGNDGSFDANDPSILSQGPRGTFSPSQLLITLGENANLSTFLHESGHFFLEVMADLASQPGAPAQTADDMAKLLKWFGIKGDENAGGADSGGELAQADPGGSYALQALAYSLPDEAQTELFGENGLIYYAKLRPFENAQQTMLGQQVDGLGERAIRVTEPIPSDKLAELELVPASPEAREALAASLGADGMVAALGKNGQISLITPSAKEPGKFQRTIYDRKGPVSDAQHDTISDAIVAMADGGYGKLLDPERAERLISSTLAQDGPATGEAPAPTPKRTPLETWNAMTLDQKRPYHEKFAESMEQYFLEGKAPSAELQPVFRRFRSWMLNAYKSLTEFMRGRNLKLNDEIRQVFDRMLATDEQIAAAEQRAGLMPDFDATAEATEKLQARSMRDLKWTVNARSKAIKKLQAEAKELRKGVEAEVREEVEAQPVYAARKALRAGTKLSIEGLESLYMGEGDRYALLDWKPLVDQKMAGKTGMHPDIAADMFGFKSGDELVRALLTAEPIGSVIEGMTDQRMLERHGDLIDQRAIEEAANEAVHNEARAKSLATELKAQGEMLNPRADTGRTNTQGRPITVNAIVAAAKEFAENLTARRRVKDLKNAAHQHRAAEARAAKRWTEATAAGKTAEAVQAKRDQVLNHATAKAMQEAQAEAKKILEFFARVTKGNDEKTVTRGRDPDVVNAARAILAAYDIAPRLEKGALDYLAILEKNDPSMYAALQPSVAGAMNNAKPVGELTMEELRGLKDEIDAMWHLAKRSRQMEVDGNMLDIEDAADQLKERMQEIGVPDTMPGDERAITDAEKRARWLQHAGSLLRRAEQWAEGMDGKFGGPFLRLVFQPVKEAANRYRADRVKYRKAYQSLVDQVAPSLRKGPIAAPELGYTFGEGHNGIGHAELLHAILHTGNESNKRKLLLGRKWATENADGTLDTSRWDAFIARMHATGVLGKAHYDFAQGVWDLLEQTKPLAQKTHRDVFGRYFAEVTADEVVTPFGSYRGGYVPAQADPRIVQDADLRKLAEAENENMAYSFPATNKGFTKGRVEYNRPLLLDLRTIGQHIDKVLLFSHMEPAVRDVNKLLSQKGVAYSLGRIDPTIYAGMLTPWLSRSARQIVETPIVGDGGISRVLSAARSRAGMALMFANVSNSLQQLTGFAGAFAKLKADGLNSQMLRATAQFITNPKAMSRNVAGASEFMEGRMENEIAAINDAMDQILLDPSLYEKSQAWTRKHAYFMQTAFANTMEPIIWTAGYNGALEKGMSEADAVRYADGLIRQTQGSTLPEDVSRIETGPAYARVFTQFIGYFNMMANTNATGLKQIAQDVGLKKGAGKALLLITAGMMIPLWVAEAIAIGMRGGPEDEDDDGYLDDWIASVLGMGTIKGAFAMVPFVGTVANVALNKMNSNPADDKASLSPAVSLLEAGAGVPKLIYQAATDPDKINARNAVRDVSSALSLATGLPFYALSRPLGYLAGVADDRIEPTGPVDAVRGAITGSASPDSKQ